MGSDHRTIAVLALVLVVAFGSWAVAAQDFGDAEPIDEGETTGEITDGGSDLYKLDANTTDALDLTLTPDSEDLALRIYDENQQVIAEDDFVPAGDTNQVTKKLPVNGTFYIEVDAGGSDATGYTLGVDVVTPEENDDFAPNDGFQSAAPIEEGTTNAKIWGGESDFFVLEANTTDALDVRLTPDSEDLTFRIYDENREVLVEDTFVPAGDTNRLTKKLPDTGTYYVEVVGGGRDTTNYTLDLDVVTPEENDDFAPNDGFQSAAQIEEGITNAKIWGGEADFFVLEANTTDALDVLLTPDSEDLTFRIYDENREVLVEDTFVPAGDTNRLTKKLPDTGTYYVEVVGGGQATTEYTLDLDVVTPEENDDFAPNDGFQSAAQIEEGITNAKIWGGEADFFVLEANTTDALDLRLTPDSEDLTFRIYDKNREVLVEDTFVPAGDTNRLIKKLPDTGTYYVEVVGGGQATTDYTLDLDVVTPEENDDFAPNDGFDSAASIDEGFTDAKIWGGEADFFVLEANTTDALDVSLTPDSEDLTFRIYDENREVLVEDTFVPAGDANRLVRKLPETGTFYIEVVGGGQATTDYTLDLDVVTPDENDDYAPNDDFDSATAIPQEFTDAKLWGGESDVFVAGVREGETFSVSLTPQNDDMGVAIYGPDRETLAEDTFVGSGSSETLEVETESTGFYYVELFGANKQSTTEYTLQSNKIGDDFDGALVVGQKPATDTTGDGKLNDIDGDETFDLRDVQALARNIDRENVRQNPRYFDFDGDDDVDFEDVLALLDQLRSESGIEYPDLAIYAGDDGVVETDGLRVAVDAWRSGAIESTALQEVIDAWSSGDRVEPSSAD